MSWKIKEMTPRFSAVVDKRGRIVALTEAMDQLPLLVSAPNLLKACKLAFAELDSETCKPAVYRYLKETIEQTQSATKTIRAREAVVGTTWTCRGCGYTNAIEELECPNCGVNQ